MIFVDSLNRSLTEIGEGCTECGSCVQECTYLQSYGTPAAQAAAFQNGTLEPEVIYSCSLCGLCDVSCPEDLKPTEMFWRMRCQLVEEGRGPLKQHRRILAYERRGLSGLFQLESLPDRCRTVFFPGCSLAGNRSRQVERIYGMLKSRIDDLGIVLNCCTKPSHDLGRLDYFQQSFAKLTGRFRERGISSIITACPSCHQIFSRYAAEFEVVTVYQVLAERPAELHRHLLEPLGPLELTVHDPCATRFDSAVHRSVRKLTETMGCTNKEMSHNGETTYCCGEGGSACFVAPDITDQWSLKRRAETSGRQVLTYCTGCVRFLSKKFSTIHLLDLLCDPARALKGKSAATRSPFTYINRLLLKARLKKNQP